LKVVVMCCDLSLAAILSKAGCREEAAYTVRLDGGFVLPEPSLPPHEIKTTSATTASPLLITGEILAGKSTSPPGPSLSRWRPPPDRDGAQQHRTQCPLLMALRFHDRDPRRHHQPLHRHPGRHRDERLADHSPRPAEARRRARWPDRTRGGASPSGGGRNRAAGRRPFRRPPGRRFLRVHERRPLGLLID